MLQLGVKILHDTLGVFSSIPTGGLAGFWSHHLSNRFTKTPKKHMGTNIQNIEVSSTQLFDVQTGTWEFASLKSCWRQTTFNPHHSAPQFISWIFFRSRSSCGDITTCPRGKEEILQAAGATGIAKHLTNTTISKQIMLN